MLLTHLFSAQAFALGGQAGSQDDTFQPRDYLSISIETAREGSTKPVKLKSVRVRFAKADGQWKQYLVSPSGRVAIYRAKPDGIYFGEPGNMYLTNEFRKPPAVFHSAKFLRSHKQFVREESLLGYRTYVIRGERGKDGYTEMHMSAEFGIMPVKRVTHLPTGQESVTEAVKIEFIETTDKMLNDEGLEPLNIYLTKGIEAVAAQGRSALAEEMRLIQKRVQAKRKK